MRGEHEEAPAGVSRRGYRPELDGIRGVAILLVLVGHLAGNALAGAGVGLFFVLSGYLITGVLLRERSRVAFYVRRAGRLVPALVVVVVAMALTGSVGIAVGSAAYVANWPLALGASTATPWSHVWSLSIEEQFYLVWPWLLPFVGWRWAVAIGLGSMALRFLIPDNALMYYATLTRLDGLAFGAALALVPTFRLPRWSGYLAVVVLVMLGIASVDLRWMLAGTTLAGMVLVASAPRRLAVLAPLGRISYSLYLYHWPLFVWFGPVGLLAAIPLAYASTRWLEEPIREWARTIGGTNLRIVAADSVS